MFSKTIVDSDVFLDLSLKAQALYFHLSMRADDEGFVNNPRKITRMIGASEDELNLLVTRNFILPFESGVCAIKHWQIHNYIQSDRFKPTVYTEEKSQLTVEGNKAYTKLAHPNVPCIQNGSKMDPQDRIGKDRLEEDRLSEDRIEKDSLREDKLGEERLDNLAAELPALPSPLIPYEIIRKTYNETCPSFPQCTKMNEERKKSIQACMASGYTISDFETVFSKAEASSFLRGRNERSWTASFDWLIKDQNMAKVLDGNYDEPQVQRSSNPFLQILREEEACNEQK